MGISSNRIVLAAVILVLGISAAFLAKRSSPNKNDAKLYEVRQVYSTLALHPSLVETGSSFQSKAELAEVTKYYRSSVSYEEVKDFYQRHLVENQWALIEEGSITDWGRDFGGRKLTFRKNQYRLVIQYEGKGTDEQWNYAISLVWKT